jgi:hypothetical protein
MVKGFATGRVLGYITWCHCMPIHLVSRSMTVRNFRFLEAFPVFLWNYKWKREVCQGCGCCCCFGVAALNDDKDPRVAMLKNTSPAAQTAQFAVPNNMTPP